MHTLTHQELRELALSKRQVGVLTFEFRERAALTASPESTADFFVASLGFKQLGKAWRVIGRAEALGCLQHILYHDLAYQQPLMEQKTAQFIAESFLALFSSYDCRFSRMGHSTSGACSVGIRLQSPLLTMASLHLTRRASE